MKYFFIIILICSISIYAQNDNKKFSLGLNFVYTTNARIFLDPNSSNPIERNNSFELSDIINPGINFGYRILDEVFLDLNIEYMKSKAIGKNERVITNAGAEDINVEDGFKMMPFELSIYYLLPFSTENFKFLMGGGMGYYYGSMIRKFGDAEVSTVQRDIAYGIQVAFKVNYLLWENISLKAEMEFRDPEFTVKNRYNNNEYNYNGKIVRVTRQEFNTKINVNGVSFVFGTVFYF